jgi:2-iminobutanoate/2-iminopropanoate deaminase
MARDSITAATAPQPRGPYSQAVRAAGLVFVAGQLPLDRDGALVGAGDVRAQAAAVLANMRAILEAAGSSMDRVVKTTVFLANLDDFAAMNEAYSAAFASPFPARSTVQVGRLPPGMLIEIDCIAEAGPA